VRPGEVIVSFGHPIPTAGLDFDARERLGLAARAEVQRLAAEA
jgi:hypothetical protein